MRIGGRGRLPAPDLREVAVEAERGRLEEGRGLAWWENPWPLGAAVMAALVLLNIFVG